MAHSATGQDKLVAVNVMVSRGEQSPAALKKTFSKAGVLDIEQTFPHEADEELNRLYVLKVKSSEVKDVVSKLRQSAAVEYAEAAPTRGLI